MRYGGALLVLASAACFGAMAVFGKLAYDAGATPGTLLSVRFLLAATAWWAILAASRGGRAALRGLRRRDVVTALALGACGYALQAGAFFAALERLDASLLSLLLYTYPAVVAVAAVALGRDRLDGRRIAALALAGAGVALVLAGAGTGALDPLGAALGLASAFLYSAYILVSQDAAGRLPAALLATFVCSGAAVTLTLGAATLGELRPDELEAAGWLWLACLAAVSTVAAIALFFAGLRRVGPTSAAILSTVEPVVTVVLAALVFGESLAPVQVLGGALVLAAVPVLHLRVSRARRAPAAA